MDDKEKKDTSFQTVDEIARDTPKPKFEVYGSEMIEKKVRSSGNSGRVYLPPEWVGKTVKIIRIN